MKNYQLQTIALGLLLMIQFICATPTGNGNKEINSKNCTILAQNVSLVNQEELKDPQSSEEFKAEILHYLKVLKNEVQDVDREKRHSIEHYTALSVL